MAKRTDTKKNQPEELEQIAIKLFGQEARLKQCFQEMLDRRGLSMRQRMIEYMRLDVKYDGEVFMMPLEAPTLSTGFPQDGNSYDGSLVEARVKSGDERWHNYLAVVLSHSSEELRDLIKNALDTVVKVTQQRFVEPKVDGADHQVAHQPRMEATSSKDSRRPKGANPEGRQGRKSDEQDTATQEPRPAAHP